MGGWTYCEVENFDCWRAAGRKYPAEPDPSESIIAPPPPCASTASVPRKLQLASWLDGSGKLVFTYLSLVPNSTPKGNQVAGVNVKLVEGTMGVATAGPHAIVVDRSLANGGTYLGMVGGELLLSAIGTCLMTTLVGAARARNIELTRVEFDVFGEHQDAPSRYTSIDVDAIVEADASQEEIDRLLAIAKRACTVSNTVARSAPVEVRRKVAEVAGV